MNKRNHRFFINCMQSVLLQLDTPIALGVSLRIKYGVRGVPNVHPAMYNCPDSYFKDAQAVALIKKNPWYMDSSKSAADSALEKFLECERICKATNINLQSKLKQFELRSTVERARRYMSLILGKFEWSEPDFGPGASYSLAGMSSDYISKLGTLPECTAVSHRHVLQLLLEKMPHYCLSSGLVARDRTSVRLTTTRLPIVKGNRFRTVPKTTDTDRPICIEPLGNMLCQKAIAGTMIRRLKAWGIDLKSRARMHRNYILTQRYVDFATIDLSSASDTVSWAVVKLLLPSDWFTVMDQCRSRYTELPDGSWIENEKFSSMGNGFTFELETLIFYTLSLAIRDEVGKKNHIVSVFGDDILCHPSVFDRTISVLTDLGFIPNYDKSFKDGPFRESCGVDGWNNIMVRPVYIKEMSKNEIEQLYYMARRIYEICRRITFSDMRDIRFRSIIERIISRVPKHLRCFGPYWFGDQVLPPLQRVAIKGRCRVLERVSRRKRLPSNPDHALACALYGIASSGLVTRGARYTVKARYRATTNWWYEPIWI